MSFRTTPTLVLATALTAGCFNPRALPLATYEETESSAHASSSSGDDSQPEATTSVATSESMSTDGGTVEEGGTTEDGTSTEWHGESEGETGYRGDKVCFLACEQPIDCCGGSSYCEDSLGEYPYNLGCERGVCASEGCTNDDQCTLGGVLSDWQCVDIDGYGACLPPCTTQDDCSDFEGWTCEEGVCMWPPGETETCENDTDCDDGQVCAPFG